MSRTFSMPPLRSQRGEPLPMKLLMIGFEDRRIAELALDEVEIACDETGAQLSDLALAFQSQSGKSRVRQTSDAGSGPGMVRGGVLGLLTAIAAPTTGTVAATVVGGALGGVIAGVGDEAVDNKMMRSLAMVVNDADGAVLALGEGAELGKLRDVLLPYYDRTQCQPVPEATAYLIRELSKLSMEDLENR